MQIKSRFRHYLLFAVLFIFLFAVMMWIKSIVFNKSPTTVNVVLIAFWAVNLKDAYDYTGIADSFHPPHIKSHHTSEEAAITFSITPAILGNLSNPSKPA